ncbi:MAG TPA: translocation/assembly module TamB domain-containing protein, partial [Phnomibacter sp.]|nr:translocation/assembly module TamB domain-containing protein [Phnomibacter sp.]
VMGELLKPDISFDLEIAETSGTSAEVVSTVNNKLNQLRQQESEMTKQVFGLILLGSFIPESPFGSGSGGANASAFARQSVSKLLSDQLNQLAGSLITGIDVDIGILSEEDYSMGTGQIRTDLNVAFSKRLLKDRLKITVGSNFELEGAARPNERTSNIAGDIKADYALSRSGIYVLRAYRIDQYEVALQGQVVETGISFIITMDFDRFKELFERKK